MITAHGRVVLGGSGGGGSRVSIDGVVPPHLVGVDAGLPCEVSPDVLLYMVLRAGVYSLETWNLVTGKVTTIDTSGANTLYAGYGIYAATLSAVARTARGSRGNTQALAVGANLLVYAVDYHSERTEVGVFDQTLGQPLAIMAAGGPVIDFREFAGASCWVTSDRIARSTLAGFVDQPNPVYACQPTKFDGAWYVLEVVDFGLTVRPHDSIDGWVIVHGDAWGQDLKAVNGQLLAQWAKGSGQLPSDYLPPLVIDVTRPRDSLVPPDAPIVVPTIPPNFGRLYASDRDPFLPANDYFWTVARKPGPDGIRRDDQGHTLDWWIDKCLHDGQLLNMYRDGVPWDGQGDDEVAHARSRGVLVQRCDCAYPDPKLSEDANVNRYPVRWDIIPLLAYFRHIDWPKQMTLNVTARIYNKIAGKTPGCAWGLDRPTQTDADFLELYNRTIASIRYPPPKPEPPKEEYPMTEAIWKTLDGKYLACSFVSDRPVLASTTDPAQAWRTNVIVVAPNGEGKGGVGAAVLIDSKSPARNPFALMKDGAIVDGLTLGATLHCPVGSGAIFELGKSESGTGFYLCTYNDPAPGGRGVIGLCYRQDLPNGLMESAMLDGTGPDGGQKRPGSVMTFVPVDPKTGAVITNFR